MPCILIHISMNTYIKIYIKEHNLMLVVCQGFATPNNEEVPLSK